MKKNISALWALSLCLGIASCNSASSGELLFDFSEKDISSGDYVTLSRGKASSYRFIGSVPSGVSLDSNSGLIEYGKEIPAGTQLLYKAVAGKKESNAVVLTLTQPEEEGEVVFSNLTSRLSSGDRVYASCTNGKAVSFALEGSVPGISLDSSSGVVSFAKGVEEGTSFVVTATSGDFHASKTFTAAVDGLVSAKGDLAYFESGSANPVAYFLSYPDNIADPEKEFLGVLLDGRILSGSEFEFDASLSKVLIHSSALSSLSYGKHRVSLVTGRNNVNVTLSVATKFIQSPEDLASISSSREALKGYYVQTGDIDLTAYLSSSGEGYDEGRGWKPIGSYRDVADGTAFLDSFQGTYDGGGYSIRGLWMNRSDESAYNAGLFGYVYSTALIENLGVYGTDSSFRSFVGGFVGSNDGTIKNCFYQGSSLSSYSGEGIFRYLGGFVGQNQGTISQCYSYVKSIKGDRAYGGFVGNNLGEISSCFSLTDQELPFQGEGVPASKSQSYSSAEEASQFPKEDWDEGVWSFSSPLPSLKNNLVFSGIAAISLLGVPSEATIGESFPLSVAISPSSSQEEYQDKVVYSVSGSGAKIEDGVLITEGAEPGQVIVTASLEVDQKTYSSSILLTLYSKGEALDWDQQEKTLYAGNAYTLKANVLPLSSQQKVTYSLPKRVKGVRLDGDQLRISDACQGGEIKIKASSSSLSSVATFTLIPSVLTEDSPDANLLYLGEERDLTFHLPEGEEASAYTFFASGKEVEAKEVSGNQIRFPSSLILSSPNQSVAFHFQNKAEGKLYASSACYVDHAPYTKESVLKENGDAVVISSMDQFLSLFNVVDFQESRFQNYAKEKVYILDCDLDFSGMKVYSIGYDAHPFLATIYGNNHLIKNFGAGNQGKVENELGLTLDQATYPGNWNYRSSLYGVGFFGSFGGKCCDLRMEGSQIFASNWVGLFSGSVLPGGRVENVHIRSSRVGNANEVDFQISSSDSVSEFAPGNEGEFVYVSCPSLFDNLTKGND